MITKCIFARKKALPGGGVSWILFFSHHPTGKIFRELELHQMEGRLPSPQVIVLSISTWKKNSLATLETVAAQMDDGSFGLTASSFVPVVKPWGLGKLLDWNDEGFKYLHVVPHTCTCYHNTTAYKVVWLKYSKTHISYKKTENILGRLGKNKIEETNKFCSIKQQSACVCTHNLKGLAVLICVKNI